MTALLCLSSLFPFSFMVKHGNRKYLCTFVNMKTFVIAGCGRLAGIVSEAVVKGLLPEYELVGVYSRTVAKAERIAGRMAEAGKSCAVCTTADELLALKPDILVETASPAALREFAVPALKNGTSIVTLSIGALACVLPGSMRNGQGERDTYLYRFGSYRRVRCLAHSSLDGEGDCPFLQ